REFRRSRATISLGSAEPTHFHPWDRSAGSPPRHSRRRIAATHDHQTDRQERRAPQAAGACPTAYSASSTANSPTTGAGREVEIHRASRLLPSYAGDRSAVGRLSTAKTSRLTANRART